MEQGKGVSEMSSWHRNSSIENTLFHFIALYIQRIIKCIIDYSLQSTLGGAIRLSKVVAKERPTMLFQLKRFDTSARLFTL